MDTFRMNFTLEMKGYLTTILIKGEQNKHMFGSVKKKVIKI